ncbi:MULTISPECIES: hypothetical protein [unclassified Ruegeria]|uniref:hypothetical protein n=1 Tax=unclassified Ruegeria TaxID=2625375 RepID=UPI001487EFF8|nr:MULTISPECIES: hypothetical protein [unclassified Ruegeria]
MDWPKLPTRQFMIDTFMFGHPPPPEDDPTRASYFTVMKANIRSSDAPRGFKGLGLIGSWPWDDMNRPTK